MAKGITHSCKKHVLAFPKEKEEVTRRLWLSAIYRDADSFNPENFILKQKILKQIMLHVLALLEYGCV